MQALRHDPEVDFVDRDAVVSIETSVPLAPGEPSPPTGVRRILAATSTAVREASGVNVAVLDTGVQLDHPDLDAESGTNCIDSGQPASDRHGHGTHVAGTIAAENDGAGVAGVAPGTTVYSVKVLGDDGSGTRSSVICGIDWVTANAEARDIRVANMSLGGGGSPPQPCATTTDAEHKAMCRSTAVGVNYAVAAGNDGEAFDEQVQVPAAYPEVLTVTAISDTDGLPGGTDGQMSCSGSRDDEAATFSNWASTAEGEAHTIAAPGVCIRSTWTGGGYRTISGTSMASPHIAGTLALCLDEGGAPGPCAGGGTAEVIELMRAHAEAFNGENPNYGFLHDPLHSPRPGAYYGFLARAPGDNPPPPSPPPPANDPFASAEDLGATSSASARGTNVAATHESAEPDHGWGGRASVWYRWTAPSSGDYVIDLCGSTYDTVLAVYTGPAVDSLSEVARDDDGSCSRTSLVTIAASAGTTYRIAVDGWRSSQGDIDLRIAPIGVAEEAANEPAPDPPPADPALARPPEAPPAEPDDSSPPETAIAKAPRRKVRKARVKFRFAASEPGATFEYSLDGKRFRASDRSLELKVKRGKHVLAVRATDAAGNLDATPATHVWKRKRRGNAR